MHAMFTFTTEVFLTPPRALTTSLLASALEQLVSSSLHMLIKQMQQINILLGTHLARLNLANYYYFHNTMALTLVKFSPGSYTVFM